MLNIVIVIKVVVAAAAAAAELLSLLLDVHLSQWLLLEFVTVVMEYVVQDRS